MKRFFLFFVVPALLLQLVAVLPLVTGEGTLYTRDVLTGHFEMKSAQARAWDAGENPLIDPWRGGGQPSMGNPNTLPLYPDNLLYRLGSPLWALNAHFWLHWLLAPFAVFWLGRAWRLSPPAAWAAGVCYAGSGFMLSLFNLYNLIAGAALAPAFVAACLDADSRTGGRPRRRTAWLEVGALWGLLLLAGDPLFAVLAALLAAGALVARRRAGGGADTNGRTPWPALVGGLGLSTLAGSLLAAPMLVEMARILPLSFRGYWQFSPQAALSQSWDPRALAEWVFPFVFGRPDFSFWGFDFYGGNPPLLYSLYPGLLAMALVLVAGRPRADRTIWAWVAVGAGLFLALGAHNPLVRILLQLPGASLLRYPVKCWLVVALGGALLCGEGYERLSQRDGQRLLGRVLLAFTVLFAAVWIALVTLPGGLGEVLRQLDPKRLGGSLFDFELQRWRGICLLSFGLSGLLALASRLLERRPGVGGALLLALHLAAQTFFLAPLIDADDAEPYRERPAALDFVPEGARIVHGGFGETFGRQPGSPLEIYPDPRFFWLSRTHFAEVQPFAAVQWGLEAELYHSPEGLDSFYLVSLTRAMRRLEDPARVQILRSSGVDTLLLGRPLDSTALDQVTLRAKLPSDGHDLWIYEIRDTAPDVQVVGSVRFAPHMDAAIALLTDPDLDPRSTTVLPGDGEPIDRPAGELTVTHDSAERFEAVVRSPAGGVLVTQRAFLGIHRATIDDEPTEPRVVNIHRLGLELPPGEHRVALWVDRRAYRVAWLVALVVLAALLASPWIVFARVEDGLDNDGPESRSPSEEGAPLR